MIINYDDVLMTLRTFCLIYSVFQSRNVQNGYNLLAQISTIWHNFAQFIIFLVFVFFVIIIMKKRGTQNEK